MCWPLVAASENGAAVETFDDYEQDRQFRRAVEREFEIIGESLGRLSLADSAVAARISELHRIIGFRNRIIHGYDAIDDAAAWGVAESHLPLLVTQVEALLEEAGESP